MSAAHDYRHDLDTLRALAVTLVLVFHFALIPGMSGGFLGVDVFFVISGYIITRRNLRAALDGQFTLAAFWTARVRRLAPALLVTLIATLLAGWWLQLPSQLESLAKQALATQGYVANIFYWRTVNYFGLQAKALPLLHTWSLAVEEQFYIVYPLLLLAAARLKLTRFTLLLGAITVASFVLCLLTIEGRPEATFYLAPTRAWELGAGCLLACWELMRNATPKPGDTPGAMWKFGLCLAVVIGSSMLHSSGFRTPGTYTLLPVLGTVGIIALGDRLEGGVRTLWLNPVLRYVGKISYPLYLTHWPINVFAKDLLHGAYTWDIRLACALLSVASAAAIYELVEKRISAIRGLNLRRVLPPYLAITALLAAVCAWIWSTGGAPQRFSAEVNTLLKAERDRPASLEHCIPGRQQPATAYTDPGCLLGQAGPEPSVVVLGDSHAWVEADVISSALSTAGLAGRIVFHHACPPLMGVHMQDGGQDECFRHNVATFDWVIQNRRIEHVVLVSTWIQGDADLTDNPIVAPTPESSRALFAQAMATTVRTLKQAGKKVYVVAPVPGARYDVPRALARNAMAHRPLGEGVSYTREQHQQRHAYFWRGLEGVKDELAGSFDPASVLCDATSCAVAIEGRALYFDSDHLSTLGAQLLRPGLTQMLSAARR